MLSSDDLSLPPFPTYSLTVEKLLINLNYLLCTIFFSVEEHHEELNCRDFDWIYALKNAKTQRRTIFSSLQLSLFFIHDESDKFVERKTTKFFVSSTNYLILRVQKVISFLAKCEHAASMEKVVCGLRWVVVVTEAKRAAAKKRREEKSCWHFFRFIKNHNRSLCSCATLGQCDPTQPHTTSARFFCWSISVLCDEEKGKSFFVFRFFCVFSELLLFCSSTPHFAPFLIEFIPSEIILMFLQIYCYSSATFSSSLLFLSVKIFIFATSSCSVDDGNSLLLLLGCFSCWKFSGKVFHHLVLLHE